MNTPNKQLLSYQLSLSVVTYDEFWRFSIKDVKSSKYTTVFLSPPTTFYKADACVCMCVFNQKKGSECYTPYN